MSRLVQFLIIMLFAFSGEVAAAVIPLPIAGPIWGMALLLVALILGMPARFVENAANFILGFLGLFFIAPAAGILEIFDSIRPVWPFLILVLVVTYLAVMLSTGVAAEVMLKLRNKK